MKHSERKKKEEQLIAEKDKLWRIITNLNTNLSKLQEEEKTLRKIIKDTENRAFEKNVSLDD